MDGMNKIVRQANAVKCETVIKNLRKRQIDGYYCETVREANEKLLSFIHDGETVSWGGSVTLDEIDVKEKISMLGAKVIDVWAYEKPEESMEAKRKALSSDVFITSTNAVTIDGQLVNIDGTGNRVAAMAFGPEKVIIVAGVNKIASNVGDALERIKSKACTANAIRLGKQTPCAKTGECANCLIPGETLCCSTVITRFSNRKGRMHVILVNEELGY